MPAITIKHPLSPITLLINGKYRVITNDDIFIATVFTDIPIVRIFTGITSTVQSDDKGMTPMEPMKMENAKLATGTQRNNVKS